MKKLMTVLLVACVVCSVYAYKQEDLDKLLKTNCCQGGDLTCANRRGANLQGADLYGAICEDTVMPNGSKYTGSGEKYDGPLCSGQPNVEPEAKTLKK